VAWGGVYELRGLWRGKRRWLLGTLFVDEAGSHIALKN
jgi:hypothetical protein